MSALLVLGILVVGGAVTYSLVVPLRYFLARGAQRYEAEKTANVLPTVLEFDGLTPAMVDEYIETFRERECRSDDV